MDSYTSRVFRSTAQTAYSKFESMKSSLDQVDYVAKEKALEEERKREQERPLEEAKEEIRILSGKLSRREEALCVLRRKVALDLLQLKLGNGDESSIVEIRNRIMDESKAADVKIIELEETISKNKILLDDQNDIIDRLKSKTRQESQRFKERVITFDKQNFLLNDHIHRLENDKRALNILLHNKDIIIEKQTKELEDLHYELEINLKAEEQKKINGELMKKYNDLMIEFSKKSNILLELQNERVMKLNMKMNAEYEELNQKYLSLVEALDTILAGKVFESAEYDANINNMHNGNITNMKGRSPATLKTTLFNSPNLRTYSPSAKNRIGFNALLGNLGGGGGDDEMAAMNDNIDDGENPETNINSNKNSPIMSKRPASATYRTDKGVTAGRSSTSPLARQPTRMGKQHTDDYRNNNSGGGKGPLNAFGTNVAEQKEREKRVEKLMSLYMQLHKQKSNPIQADGSTTATATSGEQGAAGGGGRVIPPNAGNTAEKDNTIASQKEEIASLKRQVSELEEMVSTYQLKEVEKNDPAYQALQAEQYGFKISLLEIDNKRLEDELRELKLKLSKDIDGVTSNSSDSEDVEGESQDEMSITQLNNDGAGANQQQSGYGGSSRKMNGKSSLFGAMKAPLSDNSRIRVKKSNGSPRSGRAGSVRKFSSASRGQERDDGIARTHPSYSIMTDIYRNPSGISTDARSAYSKAQNKKNKDSGVGSTSQKTKDKEKLYSSMDINDSRSPRIDDVMTDDLSEIVFKKSSDDSEQPVYREITCKAVIPTVKVTLSPLLHSILDAKEETEQCEEVEDGIADPEPAEPCYNFKSVNPTSIYVKKGDLVQMYSEGIQAKVTSKHRHTQVENRPTTASTVQTDLRDMPHPDEGYLDKIFTDFSKLSKHMVPYRDFSHGLSHSQSNSQSQLPQIGVVDGGGLKRIPSQSQWQNPEKLPKNEEIQRRLRRTLSYVTEAQKIRDKFLTDLLHCPLWETRNSRVLIDCINLMLQSCHFFLSPGMKDVESEYPILLHSLTDPVDAATKCNTDNEVDRQPSPPPANLVNVQVGSSTAVPMKHSNWSGKMFSTNPSRETLERLPNSGERTRFSAEMGRIGVSSSAGGTGTGTDRGDYDDDLRDLRVGKSSSRLNLLSQSASRTKVGGAAAGGGNGGGGTSNHNVEVTKASAPNPETLPTATTTAHKETPPIPTAAPLSATTDNKLLTTNTSFQSSTRPMTVSFHQDNKSKGVGDSDSEILSVDDPLSLEANLNYPLQKEDENTPASELSPSDGVRGRQSIVNSIVAHSGGSRQEDYDKSILSLIDLSLSMSDNGSGEDKDDPNQDHRRGNSMKEGGTKSPPRSGAPSRNNSIPTLQGKKKSLSRMKVQESLITDKYYHPPNSMENITNPDNPNGTGNMSSVLSVSLLSRFTDPAATIGMDPNMAPLVDVTPEPLAFSLLSTASSNWHPDDALGNLTYSHRTAYNMLPRQSSDVLIVDTNPDASLEQFANAYRLGIGMGPGPSLNQQMATDHRRRDVNSTSPSPTRSRSKQSPRSGRLPSPPKDRSSPRPSSGRIRPVVRPSIRPISSSAAQRTTSKGIAKVNETFQIFGESKPKHKDSPRKNTTTPVNDEDTHDDVEFYAISRTPILSQTMPLIDDSGVLRERPKSANPMLRLHSSTSKKGVTKISKARETLAFFQKM